MDFAYEVTGRETPFIDQCGLEEDEACLPLVEEANSQWKNLRYFLGKDGKSYDVNHKVDEERKKTVYEKMIQRFLEITSV